MSDVILGTGPARLAGVTVAPDRGDYTQQEGRMTRQHVAAFAVGSVLGLIGVTAWVLRGAVGWRA